MTEKNPKRCVEDRAVKPESWVPKCSFFLYDGLYKGVLKACTVNRDTHELSTMEIAQTERCGCDSFKPKRSLVVKEDTPDFLKKIVIGLDDGVIHDGGNPTEGKASR